MPKYLLHRPPASKGLHMHANDLLTAAAKEDLNAIMHCLQQGIDINYQSLVEKTSALMLVAKLGNFELLNFLLEMGADAKLHDKHGNTALDMAMNLGVSGMPLVKALLWATNTGEEPLASEAHFSAEVLFGYDEARSRSSSTSASPSPVRDLSTLKITPLEIEDSNAIELKRFPYR
jgi:hypothetical protein